MDKRIKKSTNKTVNRANRSHKADMFKFVPKHINHMVQVIGAIHPVVIKIYEHVFNGGTIDQIDHEDMVILILNQQVKKGIFKRKSYGTLYDRNVIFINKITGDIRLKEPAHWGHLDIGEIEERLNTMEQYKLI